MRVWLRKLSTAARPKAYGWHALRSFWGCTARQEQHWECQHGDGALR